MTEHRIKKDPWEEAYINQYRDAAIGRLFKGLVHNLNGIIHVFSMQTELAGLMYGQADDMLQQLLDSFPDESAREHAINLKDMLKQRAQMMSQVYDKISTGRDIMRNIQPLSDIREPGLSRPYDLNTLVREEVELLHADSFFKHKVTKELKLADKLPPLNGFEPELHCAFFALIENALEEIKPSPADTQPEEAEEFIEGQPSVIIETACREGRFIISVQDSGAGIAESEIEMIFAPFFTTKTNHAGLGLYLAKQIMVARGGEIFCESSPGSTRFILSFPADRD
ncbi:MAG: HAMP domain-containing sensor histidine kinase [Thermodesulfobacteriota bacterium]|nr:HAMP domain-containing sensor histidine kinase [Thermodesulfobacteriota bacterium]